METDLRRAPFSCGGGEVPRGTAIAMGVASRIDSLGVAGADAFDVGGAQQQRRGRCVWPAPRDRQAARVVLRVHGVRQCAT